MIYSVKHFALHLIAKDVIRIKKQDDNRQSADGLSPSDRDIPINAKLGYLLDFYGDLLTERQREIAELYWSDDLSLGETAELTGLSRQGVRASLEKTRATLTEYEDKLGLARRFSRMQELTDMMERELCAPSPDTVRLKQLCNALGELYR